MSVIATIGAVISTIAELISIKPVFDWLCTRWARPDNPKEERPEDTKPPSHPPGTLNRGALTACEFEIHPNYARESLWQSLADIRVEINTHARFGSTFLIPSGDVPLEMRDADTFRQVPAILQKKRGIAVEFISRHKGRKIRGHYFNFERGPGRRPGVKVYSKEFDDFLIERSKT